MKKLLVLLAILSVCGTSHAQVKISDMPTFIGNPSGGWVPIVIAGVNRKIDAVYFGSNVDLSGIYTKTQVDSINALQTLQVVATRGSTYTGDITIREFLIGSGGTSTNTIFSNSNGFPSGGNNTFFGNGTAMTPSTGVSNTLIGSTAGANSRFTSSYNTALGYLAMSAPNSQNLNYNTVLGAQTRLFEGSNKNIVLGWEGGTDSATLPVYNNTFLISDSVMHMRYKLDSAAGDAPSIIGRDGATNLWHVYRFPGSGSFVTPSRTISTTAPLAGGGDLSANRTFTIADAVADGLTKGAATFTAADFNTTTGNVSIDYTNAQKATASVPGFLTAADWTTFNGKRPGLFPTGVKTANYTAVSGDFVAGDISGGSFTVTLPTAPADQTTIAVKVVSLPGSNSLTIAAGGADVFNKTGGSTSLTLNAQFAAVILQYKSSTGIWYVQSTDQALTVASPITNTQGVLGILNQGTATTVLHGNPSGSANFSGVVAADISGKIDTAHLAIRVINAAYPVETSATQDSLKLHQSYKDSLLAKTDTAAMIATKNDISLIPQDFGTMQILQALGGTAKAISPGMVSIGGGTAFALNDAQVMGTAVYLQKAATITGVQMELQVQGSYTGDNYNGVGLYTISGGTYTLVASSTNSATLWSSVASAANLTVPFSSTYNAAPGTYMVGFLYNQSAQTTQPSVSAGAPGGSAGFGLFTTNSNKRVWQLAAQNTLPSTITASATTGASNQIGFILY